MLRGNENVICSGLKEVHADQPIREPWLLHMRTGAVTTCCAAAGRPCRPTRRPPIACCWRTAGPPTPSCARHSLPSSIGSPRFSRPRQKIRSSHTPSAAAPGELSRPCRPSPPSLICSLRFLQVLWTSRLGHGQLIAAAGVHVTSLRLRQSKLPDRRYSQSYRTNKIIPLIPDLEVWPTVLAAVAAADAPSEAACRRCQMSLEECSGCIVPLT